MHLLQSLLIRIYHYRDFLAHIELEAKAPLVDLELHYVKSSRPFEFRRAL